MEQEQREHDLAAARRELLVNGVADIQGSIHANDSKSAAGLVVHGLLVTGVVALSSRLGPVYENATHDAQIAIRLTLGAVLVLFLVSVGSLLRAIYPYYPRKVSRNLPNEPGYKPVFFPPIKDM